jgi:hypothetical protein
VPGLRGDLLDHVLNEEVQEHRWLDLDTEQENGPASVTDSGIEKSCPPDGRPISAGIDEQHSPFPEGSP